MKLILATRSPRRLEVMRFFNVPFEQDFPEFDESSVDTSLPPKEYANTLSDLKSQSLLSRHPDTLLITADTIVYFDQKILGKPKDEKNALEMLENLSGNWHSVFTSLTVRQGERVLTSCEETRVLFNETTEHQRQRYIEDMHCADKAGSYAVQMAGSLIVNKIEGCFYNVMGMPINTLQKLLKAFNIDLWEHIRTDASR